MIQKYPEFRPELDFPQDEQNFEMVMSAIKGRPNPPLRDERAPLQKGSFDHSHR